MNHQLICKCMLTVGIVVCSVLDAEAQLVNTSQVLYRGTRCDHVIQLLHRHGVNNSVDRSNAGSLLHHSSLGGFLVPDCELGDLIIVQVKQIDHGDAACGPRIAIVVQNQSNRDVCDFHVTAVAILGPICPTSPNATVKVGKILPGEALEVSVQLPIEALAMGNRNGQVIGFQRLVVAIDSFDQLLETNEANNLQAFDQTQIPLVAATVVEEVTESAANPAAATTVVETGESTPEAQVRQSEGSVAQLTPSTIDTSQVQRTPDELRSAIDKLGSGASDGEMATR